MFESLLGELVLVHISLVELEAGTERDNKLIMGDLAMVPEDGVIEATCILLTAGFLGHVGVNAVLEGEDVLLAVDDHLVGDLHEETSHALVSVVVSGDGVDHLDRVHEYGEGLLDGYWVAIVERLDETL